MAHLWRRWRAPLLTGIGIWLLSFPLLTAHPASIAHPAYAGAVSAATDVEKGDHKFLQALARAQRPVLTVGELAAEPAPAPAPAPIAAAPAFAVRPAAPVAPRPAPAPVIHANWIVIPRLGLSQSVGWYSDCLGRAPVPRYATWRWGCAGANNTYIMAHNPGVFTPILALHAGDIIKYSDPSGRVHTYQVSMTTIVSNTQMWPLGATAVSSLTLQTCWTWDGSRDFIVRATEI